MSRKIIIFGEGGGWHTERLSAAFEALGAEARCVPLSACGFETDEAGRGLRLPGFADGLPDGAFVRAVSAGSFEQVTLRLGLLHALQGSGVSVMNDARAIERCVDKSMTTFLLSKAGIPTPPTWVCESHDHASSIVSSEARAGGSLVVKPLFGSQGRGLRRVDDAGALPAPDEVAGVYYLQCYVERGAGKWRDWRVFVVGGRAVAAMVRQGAGWITNVGQGAGCEAASSGGALGEIAAAAAAALGAGFAGVDVIRDTSGRLQVLEVNSMPAWKGLQGVTRVDLAKTLADDFLARLGSHRETPFAARRAGHG